MRMFSLKKDDDHDQDRRLRLVKSAYEVLQNMKIPDDATDVEMLLLLSRAFSDRATVPETNQARTDKPAFVQFAPRFGGQTTH